ncbi:hypothetical protein BBO99_00009021 [Phytophthora kernoviae]|uniref:SGNH hydrolase-type esterase domain-containing protein n=1 Tax=Phytophthora kernoviae TaxID=325452 RepID=A0A3R7G4I9_9STRA|nr:hypothetical protein BBI17_009029 [Phytophthora kernoviae]RLN74261.1 hypothetical protein BBO99_00009021 [Phytophthora kernoviae]
MHWVREYALPIFAKELQFQYSPSFITVFLGANDAVLKDGPDKVVYVEICAFRQGYEPKLTKPLLAKNVHMVNKMNDKEGKIELSSKGIPINWNDENWEYYKALMVSCFEEKDLENIASGEKVLGDEADEKVRAHIVGTMDYFVAYKEFGTVKDPCRGFAQNMLTHAVGMGEVELVTKSEKGQLHKFTLDRVLYVPSAR